MSPDARAIMLAVEIVRDRITRLTKEDRDDLFALAKELSNTKTEEDWAGICDTMIEILDGEPATTEEVDLSAPTERPEQFRKWTDWVAGQIRDARKDAGLTQEQLAEKSGLPQSHISRIENARHSPARATLEKLAAALGKPVTFFDFN